MKRKQLANTSNTQVHVALVLREGREGLLRVREGRLLQVQGLHVPDLVVGRHLFEEGRYLSRLSACVETLDNNVVLANAKLGQVSFSMQV